MILQEIQTRLKAPKNQYNKFNDFKYRSCEDILEALKPILAEFDCALLLSDDIVEKGGRVYVKSTATLKTPDNKENESVTAYAREAGERKGMDAAQITGSASSYARKYALNGLFAIDDTKDADTYNTKDADTSKTQQTPRINVDHINRINACLNIPALNDCMAEIKKEMGSNFEKFRKNFTEHYKRREAEIMKETEGMGL